MKKRWLVIVVSILIIWNIVLTIMLVNKKDDSKMTVTEENVFGISTDLTKVADIGKTSCVVVESVYGKQSGFIYKQNQNTVYVVTTFHGIEDSKTASVVLANGKTYLGTVVGFDYLKDIAVLSFETEYKFNEIKCGDNELISDGEFLINIGTNDTDVSINNIMLGIVSKNLISIHDTIEYNKETYSIDKEMMSISSDITHGYSGSPVFSMKGEIIGMIEMKDDNRVYAITINELKIVVDKIINNEEVNKIDLGIKGLYIKTLKDYERNVLDIPFDIISGYYIESIDNNKLAFKLGLEQGDIIIFINGTNIENQKEMLNILYGNSEELNLLIYRNEKEIEIKGSVND